MADHTHYRHLDTMAQATGGGGGGSGSGAKPKPKNLSLVEHEEQVRQFEKELEDLEDPYQTLPFLEAVVDYMDTSIIKSYEALKKHEDKDISQYCQQIAEAWNAQFKDLSKEVSGSDHAMECMEEMREQRDKLKKTRLTEKEKGTGTGTQMPWQNSEAKDKLERGKYGEALELYRQALASICSAEHKYFKANMQMHFLNSRLGLCNLALDRLSGASHDIKDAMDEWKDNVDLFQTEKEGGTRLAEVFFAICAILLHTREWEKCFVVAAWAEDIFPESKDAFKNIMKQCLKFQPDMNGSFGDVTKKAMNEVMLPNCDGTNSQPTPPGLKEQRTNQTPQLLVRRASMCLDKKKHSHAMICLGRLKDLKDLDKSDSLMYQYCHLMTGIGTGSTMDPAITQRGLESLMKIDKTYLELSYGLSEMLIKQKLYSEAETVIRQSLELASNGEGRSFTWPPELAKHFVESSKDLMEAMLRKQLSLVVKLRMPEATCRFESCVVVAEEGGQREIFPGDGKGYYSVRCADKCTVDFHPMCWKRAKEVRGNTSAACFTPGRFFLVFVVVL